MEQPSITRSVSLAESKFLQEMQFPQGGIKYLDEMVRWKRSTPGVLTGDHHQDAAITKSEVTLKQEDDAWEAMFESLKRYREEHGNCHADRDASDTEVGQWGKSVESVHGDSCFADIPFEGVMFSCNNGGLLLYQPSSLLLIPFH